MNFWVICLQYLKLSDKFFVSHCMFKQWFLHQIVIQIEVIQEQIIQWCSFLHFWDNYTLLTCGLPLIWFAYPWFQFWHFIHLWFPPLNLCYPPPLKRRLNMYFCTIFMSLSSQNIKHKKFKRKQDKHVLLVKNIMQFLRTSTCIWTYHLNHK